jgi:hypothetical protein
MKRAQFRSRTVVAALIAALLSSLAPATGASLSARAQRIQRVRETAKVTLAHTAEVKVTASPTGVLLEWRTSFELDNLGFNVYRDQGGTRTQVNPAIIAGSALIVGQGTPLYAGYSYQWFDAAGSLDSRYYLEDIDLKGPKTLNGPFAPVWNETLPKSQQTKTISEVTAKQAATAQTGGSAGIFERPAIAPGAIQDWWAIAAQPGIKIGVRQDGWYRVTQPDLFAAGFNVSADARNLRLFVDGREVPIEVSKGSGPLGSADFLEFYGTGLDTLTTDTHVYYLINGSQAGLRVPQFGEIHTDAVPTPSRPPAPLAQATTDARSSPGAAWLGDISYGVAAVKDERKESPTVVDRSEAGAVRAIENSEVPTPIDYESNSKPASSTSKDARTEAAIKVENKGTSVRTLEVSRNEQKPRSGTRNRRRHARRRRSHSVLKSKRNHATVATASTPGFLYDVQLKERFVYFSSLLNGPAANYFGGPLVTPP